MYQPSYFADSDSLRLAKHDLKLARSFVKNGYDIAPFLTFFQDDFLTALPELYCWSKA